MISATGRASSVAVAEMAMAFMVAIPARLIEAHMAMTEGKFPKNELKRTELFGKTLGLIGAGAIATEVAKRALGFGMTVIAYDPFLISHPLAELKPLEKPEQNGKKVAVVGSGPAGLTAAWQLALKGYGVKIFEAAPTPGGMLSLGIPAYRLPRETLQKEIDSLLNVNVEVKFNQTLVAGG